jgi:Ca-activated chloride channel family protein
MNYDAPGLADGDSYTQNSYDQLAKDRVVEKKEKSMGPKVGKAESKPTAPAQKSVVSGNTGMLGGAIGGGGSALGGLGTKGDSSGAVGYGKSIAPESTVIVPDTISNAEQYTDYGVNRFVNSSDDALSTFSIDVDTASYTLARRKLQEGSLPNYAGVRVEEFVNYFDYHYDASEAKPFVVHTEIMEHPFKADKHIMRVGVQGMEYNKDTRPPLHLTFLVDVSGSMSSADKLPLAKESLHLLVDTLRDTDTVALATYAGNISKILDPTFGDNKKKIHEAIDRLSSGGSTAMSSGLDLAYEMAWKSFEHGAENRVLVVSDGDANIGNTSWETMLQQIKSYADRGVTMSTIGFGMGNYKDTNMEQLANKGDGNNFYIDSKAQAHRVFVEDFNSTMLNIARDVKIQVEFNPKAVTSYRLIGYENRDIADKDFRNDRVDAGEVGSGHNVTALYELVLDDNLSKRDTLATTRLRYEKPGADSVASELSWQTTAMDIHPEASVSDSLHLAFTAATFAEILRRSPYVGGISLEDIIAYGESHKRRGEQDDTELISLMKKARDLGAGPSLVSR